MPEMLESDSRTGPRRSRSHVRRPRRHQRYASASDRCRGGGRGGGADSDQRQPTCSAATALVFCGTEHRQVDRRRRRGVVVVDDVDGCWKRRVVDEQRAAADQETRERRRRRRRSAPVYAHRCRRGRLQSVGRRAAVSVDVDAESAIEFVSTKSKRRALCVILILALSNVIYGEYENRKRFFRFALPVWYFSNGVVALDCPTILTRY